MIRTVFAMVLLGAILLPVAASAAEPTTKPAAKAAASGGRPAGVPEAAEAWLVLPTPAKSLAEIKKIADGVMPGTGAVVQMTLLGVLTKYSGKAMDQTKPVVCLFAPGKKPKFAVGASLAPESDVAKVLETSFGKATKTEEGISTYLEVQDGALPDKEIYVAIKKGRVVAGDDKKMVTMLAAFPAPEGGAFKADVDFVAGLDVKAAAAKHKEDIEGLLKQLEAGGAQLGGPQKAILAAYAELARSALKNVELLRVTGQVSEEEVSLSYSVRGVKGGELAGALEKLAKAKLPAIQKPAQKSFVVATGSVNPEVMDQVMKLVQKLLAGVLGGEGDEALKKEFEGYLAAITAVGKQTDGRFTESLHRRGGGICAIVEGGVKDAAAARAAMIKAIKASNGDVFKRKWAEMGVTMKFTEKFRKSGDLEVDRLEIDFKPPANPKMPAEFQAQIQEMQRKAMEATYGLPIIYELAYVEKKMLAAFGKDAPRALDELVKRVKAGKAGEPAMVATLKRAPKGAFIVGELDIIEYAYFFADMMGRMMPAGQMPNVDLGAAPAKPVSFWVAARGGEFVVRYNIPVAPVKRVVDGVKKAQQEMMEQIRQQHQPVPLPDPGVERF